MCRFSLPGGALIVGLVAVIGLSTPALRVRAQATPADDRAAHAPSAAYERAISQALREFELEHYPEARSAFLRAHTLYPNARTYRALGMVEFELRNYPTSIEYLAQALASRERPLESQARAQAEELISQARSYVARYTLRVQPSHAALRLSGSPLTLDADKAIVLQVGDYVLEAEATGFVSERRELHVVGMWIAPSSCDSYPGRSSAAPNRPAPRRHASFTNGQNPCARSGGSGPRWAWWWWRP